MSAGEVIGLVLTVAFFSAAGALCLAALASRRLRHNASWQRRRREVFVAWLANWMTVSRTSASFVVAFRALASEPANSANHALRREEAQRARSDWCSAMRELDRAEAALIVWCDDPEARAHLARFDRVKPIMLQAAIDGDARDVQQLLAELQSQTASVQAFVVHWISDCPSRRGSARERIVRVLAFANRVIEQWSRA